MDPQTWWFLARASGLTAMVMLSVAVIWGLALSAKLARGKPSPAWVLDLHRGLGGLAVVFTLIHMAGLALDGYVTFGVRELFVPFASGWQPVATGLGVLALYLLLAVEATSLLRKRLSKGLWRAVHGLAFPLFLLALLHGAMAGTDSGNVVYTAFSVVAATAVMVLSVYRLVFGARRRRPRAAAKPAARSATGDPEPVGSPSASGALAAVADSG